MPKTSVRTLGSQLTIAVVGAVVAIALTGGGFAFAQEAPVAGGGVAEAIAAPNTVNSSSIVNGSVARADLKPGSLPNWAKVAGGTTGTFLAGRGASSSSRVGTGVYQVNFNRSVQGCGWSATLNDDDAGAAASGQITVERASAGDPDSLFVRTFNAAGAAANTASGDGFTVTVLC